MVNAEFGRMRTGGCISDDSEARTGCFTKVIDYIDRKCSGRTTCGFPVTSLASISTGCSQEVVSYLDATYTCADGKNTLYTSIHLNKTDVLLYTTNTVGKMSTL